MNQEAARGHFRDALSMGMFCSIEVHSSSSVLQYCHQGVSCAARCCCKKIPVGIFHRNHHAFGHTQILAGGGDGSRGGKGPSVQSGEQGGEAGAPHLALSGSGSHLSWESCRNAETPLLCLSGAPGDCRLGKCSWLTPLTLHAT